MKRPKSILRWVLGIGGCAVLIGAAFADVPGPPAKTPAEQRKTSDSPIDPAFIPKVEPPRKRTPGIETPCKRLKKPARIAGQLNLNTATRAQLMLLPGVGPNKANRILSYRSKRPFRRIKDLRRVKGFGRRTLLKLNRYLAITGESTLHAE